MRIRPRGARRALVAVLAIATMPALAGCDTSPGAAALVGGSRISVSALQHQVDEALADPQIAQALAPGSQFAQSLGGSTAGFVRMTLSRLITYRLLIAVADAHHVVVTAKDVTDQTDAFAQQAGSLQSLQQQAAESVGVTAAQLPALIRLTVLQQRLSDALIATLPATPAQLQAEYQRDIDQYDQLDVAQIAVSSRSLALQLLAKARRNPSSFAELASRYSQDPTSQANGGEVGLVGRSQVVRLLGAAKTKVGTIQLAHASGEYVVLQIKSRHLIPLSQAAPQLKSTMFASQAQTLMEQALITESSKLGVHVSPRYGRWDPTTQTVVAVNSAVDAGS